MKSSKKHPIQPLDIDLCGVVRFKSNAIVEFLLRESGITMDTLALGNFTKEDRVQFAQLIGYSLAGFADLPYVSDEDYLAAKRSFEAEDDPVKP